MRCGRSTKYKKVNIWDICGSKMETNEILGCWGYLLRQNHNFIDNRAYNIMKRLAKNMFYLLYLPYREQQINYSNTSLHVLFPKINLVAKNIRSLKEDRASKFWEADFPHLIPIGYKLIIHSDPVCRNLRTSVWFWHLLNRLCNKNTSID